MLYAFAANVLVNKGENGIINLQIVQDLELEAIIFKMGLDHTIKIRQDLVVQAGILQTIRRVEVQEEEKVVAGKEGLEVGVADQPKKICRSTVATLIPRVTFANAPKPQV